ncbi:MAG: homoserine dehydrogenase [Phycisphaerae bacterium]|jgi:homoserine dehydrogenase
MGEQFRIGLIGCGTVGQSVVRLLEAESGEIERKTGIRLELVRVADQDPSRPRMAGVPEARITDRAAAVLEDPAIQTVIELVGGTGVARDFVLQALQAGKDVVTANKALLSRHGRELYQAARRAGRCIAFEASCCGGIPLILALRCGLIANRIRALYGILNGTCNYILSAMARQGKTYAEALTEAQQAGFAELDPTLDVSGGDTAHKLTILASLAFGKDVDLDQVYVEGIDRLDAADVAAGRELGYACKLLGIADSDEQGLSLRVHPAFVRQDHPLANTHGSFNAVSVYGNWVGHTLYSGRGAGGKPTASAVVADLIDVATGNAARVFQQFRLLNDQTAPPVYVRMEELRTRFYVRIMAADRPGVMAQITRVFGDRGISLRAITQHETAAPAADGTVPVLVTTDVALEGQMRQALAEIAALPVVRARPVMIRVVEEHEEYPS